MRLFLWVIFLLAAVSPSVAQTTFTSGDCNANITISGGLTLTSTNAGNFVGCRASQGKQSGKPYFETTVNHAPVATVWGVAGGGVGANPLNASWTTGAGVVAGSDMLAGVMRADGNTYWNNVAGTGGASVASGKTIGEAFNLDTNPWQYWVTPDVTNLVCNGSGGSGSTAPKWNGSCASDPTLPGTGQATGLFPPGSTAGTGRAAFIPGGAVWPIWQGQVLDSSTFNFGATSFVGTLPSGYVAWNNSSGNPAYPGPLNPMQINVSNAPGWQATHAYVAGNRVNAGAGWSGSAYTNGQPVCLFGLVTAGTSGSSASAFNTACASGTPAGTGGIPGGSWPSATTVTDGGATWALLTRVDYATLTNAFNDTATAWAQSTNYPGGQFVRSNGNIYMQWLPFSTPAICVSASSGSGPTGTSPTNPDGTCHWMYLSPLTYSSGANIWPQQLFFDNTLEYGVQSNYNVVVTTWYGGSAQQVYGPQQPGEGIPLLMANHFDLWADQNIQCFGGYGVSTRNDNCSPWYYTVTVAPGDSFKDNFTSSTPLGIIDQTKGVTVINTAAYGSGSSAYSVTGGEPIAFSDNAVAVDRMQLSSSHGIVVGAHALFGPGNQHTNKLQITNSILDSGGGTTTPGAYFCDGGCRLNNVVLIGGSTVSGSDGARFQYQNDLVANSIIVGTGATNSTCIYNSAYFGSFPSSPAGNFYNNLCVGFSFPWAHIASGSNWSGATPGGSNNAITSPAGGYGGSFTDALGQTSTSFQLPGVNTSAGCGTGQASPCSGLTGANQLVNPTIGGSFDARIKTGADVIGAGVNYSVASVLFGQATTTPTNDIIGQAWSPQWDIAAEKFIGAAPPPTVLRLRFGFTR